MSSPTPGTQARTAPRARDEAHALPGAYLPASPTPPGYALTPASTRSPPRLPANRDAGRPAVDAGGGDAGDEPAVKPGVSAVYRTVTPVEVSLFVIGQVVVHTNGPIRVHPRRRRLRHRRRHLNPATTQPSRHRRRRHIRPTFAGHLNHVWDDMPGYGRQVDRRRPVCRRQGPEPSCALRNTRISPCRASRSPTSTQVT